MVNSFVEIDSNLTELELAWDKAALICDDIKEGYFSEAEPNDWFLKTYYNSSGIKAQILLDYLYNMKKSIEALRYLLDKDFTMEPRKTA